MKTQGQESWSGQMKLKRVLRSVASEASEKISGIEARTLEFYVENSECGVLGSIISEQEKFEDCFKKCCEIASP